MDVSRPETNLSSMLWRAASLRLDHIIDIPSTNAVVLTRILVAPTVIIDTVQQDRETLEHHGDHRGIVVAGHPAKSNEKWLYTGRNKHTGFYADNESTDNHAFIPNYASDDIRLQSQNVGYLICR